LALLHGVVDELREELAARRREVQQLHTLLAQAQAQARALPPPAADRARAPDEGVAAETPPSDEGGRLKVELEQARQQIAAFEAATDELAREREAAAAEPRRPWWRFWG
jgi:hypothetical protein